MLPTVTGQTFEKITIALDGTRFEECNFVECTIQYSGGFAEVDRCIFTANTQWKFLNAAARTIQLLKGCGFRIEYGTGPGNLSEL